MSETQTLVGRPFSEWLAATGASRILRLQSQFVVPEHRALALASFQKGRRAS